MEKEFNKKVDRLIGSLEQELKKFDSLYLMSLLNFEAISSVNRITSPNKLPDGFAQKFHYINGLVVTRQPLRASNPNKSGNLDRIIELTDELFNEYTMLWIKRPSLDGSHDPVVCRFFCNLSSPVILSIKSIFIHG